MAHLFIRPPLYILQGTVIDFSSAKLDPKNPNHTYFGYPAEFIPLHQDKPFLHPMMMNDESSDVSISDAAGPPPMMMRKSSSDLTTPSTPAPGKAFAMQQENYVLVAEACKSQEQSHQRGEGEELPKKKPSSSEVPHSAVPPMPHGLGFIEEKPSPNYFTIEEREIYNKIVHDSDGFDCPDVRPGINVPGMLKPYPLEDNTDVERKKFDYMAGLALKHYNGLNGASYQLVKVIKATIRHSAGIIYNIMLQAKDDMSGSPPQNFQARVYDSLCKYEVLFCRVEGNAELRVMGDSDKRPGCWEPKPPLFIPVGYSTSGKVMYLSSSDVPTTTANNAGGSPPPSTTTALTPAPRMVSPAFKMQHEKNVVLTQVYKPQEDSHQRGDGEQTKKKPSSSGVPHSDVPPKPRALGLIEEIHSAEDFTDEEREIYNKIVYESDGFDCPDVRPGINVPGMLKPYPLEDISDLERKEFDYMAGVALNHYNGLNNASYQLEKVIKATMRHSAGRVYNITLQAKDDMNGYPPQNFKARVYDSLNKYKVIFCRVEGNAEPMSPLDELHGCWVPKPPIFISAGYSASCKMMYESSSHVPTTTLNKAEGLPPLSTTAAATTPNNTEGLPPPSTTAAASTQAPRIVSPALEMQHENYVRFAQACKSQQHKHLHGEGEEKPKKKPRSS